MRVLRSCFFSQIHKPPIMGVVLDGDTSDTLDSAAQQSLDIGLKNNGFVINDIFEMPDGTSTEVATLEATRRTQKVGEQEMHMATMYLWLVDHAFRTSQPGGAIGMDKPMPLSVDEIKLVFEQIAMNPTYENRILIAFSEDQQPVTLARGEVRVG